eukprot:TRINITY_DN2035_c0_g1_i3.p1 TRINITY_DN2035_c0_g1~~TRINITY_DN2035_c0_g1_i3.p1  ORF type:complete len:124 (+),score=8.74 TRINITY_DN2035_c0_g1_i3:62-433(+)
MCIRDRYMGQQQTETVGGHHGKLQTEYSLGGYSNHSKNQDVDGLLDFCTKKPNETQSLTNLDKFYSSKMSIPVTAELGHENEIKSYYPLPLHYKKLSSVSTLLNFHKQVQKKHKTKELQRQGK